MCSCEEPALGKDDMGDHIAVRGTVFGIQLWVPIDTAAHSIWVEKTWFQRNGGNILHDNGIAQAVDGQRLHVEGEGSIHFSLWGRTFHEPVRVLDNLPDKVLIGRGFWRKHSFGTDLSTNTGYTTGAGTKYCGSVGKSRMQPKVESVRKVLEKEDVDFHLKNGVDYTSFSSDLTMQQRLKDLLWDRRATFKGLGCIKGVKHEIQLKENVKPICEKLRRRSPKEQEIERKAMEKLLAMGVLEPSTSPWASSNVFVTTQTCWHPREE